MKREKKEIKLNLEKLQITKLKNPRMIMGGTGPILLDDDDDNGSGKTTQTRNQQ